jgi:hypothetical protein
MHRPRVHGPGFSGARARIVHQKERNAVVYGNIACAQQLSAAFVVRESQGLRVDDTEKSGLSATMLEIRPAGFTDRRHVKAVPGRYEGYFIGAEWVTIRSSFHTWRAAKVALLRFRNGGCDRDLKIFLCHLKLGGRPESGA